MKFSSVGKYEKFPACPKLNYLDIFFLLFKNVFLSNAICCLTNKERHTGFDLL
jgi:hypothetical protein